MSEEVSERWKTEHDAKLAEARAQVERLRAILEATKPFLRASHASSAQVVLNEIEQALAPEIKP